MNILLISPANGKWRNVGRKRWSGGRTFRFSMLSLLSVAAECPPGSNIILVDEQLNDIPFSSHFDLVGITAMTATASRAFKIGDTFRSMGVPVVLGGMYPTFCPEESLLHADAVCAGEVEGIWPKIVEDARRGFLRGIYRSSEPYDLSRLKSLPRHLLSRRHYATLQAVQATRGCPNRCSFCSVSSFHGGSFRTRPIASIVEEVRNLPDHFFIFVDDNLTAEPAYARELFHALLPLKKHWMSQTTLQITDDPELVSLASRSGCVGLFVGLETFSEKNLEGVVKGFNQVEEYRSRISLLHEHGIGVEAGIVLGFDQDRVDVFSKTLHTLEDLQIDMAQISILTPLPGTPQFERMRHRIVDCDLDHFDYHHAVLQPAGMSIEELQSGHDWLTREFYSPSRIARRLRRILTMRYGFRVFPYASAINGAYFSRVRSWNIRGTDPSVKTKLQSGIVMVKAS
ncbi:MAG TPA: radical SAM protein [Thermoanaerobaculia bacterium]|nr:radical SAM protein [Thermoanaerobaculia bacterium]HUM31234.1 radical SAM protein [Thermoanaerobaculia bacterium]HXK69588.1 radical SAM protein [Thermoanaerobaculia bacterium]